MLFKEGLLMSEAKQLIQTLQWCSSAWDVVTLEIEGEVEGRMVNGKVVRCYACNPRKCEAKKMCFCWVNRQILTALST
jgi:hypothetical protein